VPLDLQVGGDGDLALELGRGPPVVVVEEGEPGGVVSCASDTRPPRRLLGDRSDDRDASVADLATQIPQPPLRGIIHENDIDESLVRLVAN
jgi:hypothetical protein